jgi:hypothetical protein
VVVAVVVDEVGVEPPANAPATAPPASSAKAANTTINFLKPIAVSSRPGVCAAPGTYVGKRSGGV